MKYFINGFRYGELYFLSFGFTEEEYKNMLAGAVIERDGNEFRIDTETEREE